LDSCQIKNLQPPLIGVAGTATALAILDQKLPVFDKHAVTNYQLTRSNVAELFAKLKSTPSHEILQLSTVMHGRHDIITAGALILESILGRFHIGSLVVSERGLRYGLALREWERHQNSIGLGGTVIRHLTDN
jgi:exopolyphosphatase/guanosine-5'-triphosphate,3'-diphosphate pyrophosphatase